ncbi:MAG: hypothetical protein AMXMBFR84_09890 [Candidatus Hydrogenedentota bacterium]
MRIVDGMIQELQHEAGITRRVLERVPMEHATWKPHAKSFSMGQLASHLADIPSWVKVTIEQEELVFDMASYKPFVAGSTQDLLSHFDGCLKEALGCMQGASNEVLLANWKLIANGATMFEMPRVAVLRGMILNHSVHHRAQLGVYLRMKDVPVPAMYGPSADEQ